MKRAFLLLMCLALIAVFSCSSSSTSTTPVDTTYAKFGQTLDAAVPAGLKVGGANADISLPLSKTLQGQCASAFEDCPYITAENGGDSQAGEILMRLWGLDYNDVCTQALVDAGTCFYCTDCNTGGITNYFIEPTMYSAPTACATISTTTAHYVNMGVDPCFFDSMIGQISNIAECETVQGGAVDISTAVPWYASWGIPQTIDFSSFYSRDSGGGIWWTVNNGGTVGNQQYFLSLDSNWLHLGFKNVDTDKFLFLGTGSPAYYQAEATAGGYTTGVNISAYAGTLSAIPASFEAMQVRVQDPHKYIERLTSNGSYVWYQSWSTNFPDTFAELDSVKNTPDTGSNRCLQVGTSIVTSKYVPLAECATSFNKTIDELNMDSNYTLKLIDGTTASEVNFSQSLTPTVSTTSCLEGTAQ